MDASPPGTYRFLGRSRVPGMDDVQSDNTVKYPRKRRNLDGDAFLEMIDKDGDPMSVKIDHVGGVWIHRQGYTIVGSPAGAFAVNHTYDEIMNLVAPYDVEEL